MPDEDESHQIADKEYGYPRVEPQIATPSHHDPPTKSTNDDANRKTKDADTLAEDLRIGERWIIGIGIATLVINTVIAVIYWQQLGQMKEATKAAVISAEAAMNALRGTSQSLDIANTALRLDKRAWVGVSPPATLNSFVVYRADGNYGISYKFILKNFGPYVALNVASNFESTSERDIGKTITEACSTARQTLSKSVPRNVHGYPLFPSEELGLPGNELGGIDRLNLDSRLLIAGCIIYNDQFGIEHKTTTCFETLDAMRSILAINRSVGKPRELHRCFVYNDAN
jgi:hypothetical protein